MSLIVPQKMSSNRKYNGRFPLCYSSKRVWKSRLYVHSLTNIRIYYNSVIFSVPAAYPNNISAQDNQGESSAYYPERGGRLYARRASRVRFSAVARLHVQADDARVEGRPHSGTCPTKQSAGN